MLIPADLSVELYNILYIESVSDFRVTVTKKEGAGVWKAPNLTHCTGFHVGNFQTYAVKCKKGAIDSLSCTDIETFNIKLQFILD